MENKDTIVQCCASYHSFPTLESFWLNFEIFLRTVWAFCWLLFQPNNQKLSNSRFNLLRTSKLSICKHLKPVESCCSLTGHLKLKPSQKLSKTFLGSNSKARSTVNKKHTISDVLRACAAWERIPVNSSFFFMDRSLSFVTFASSFSKDSLFSVVFC